MNVGGMSSENPSWGLFVNITVPGTIAGGLLIVIGKYLWPKRRWPFDVLAGGSKLIYLSLRVWIAGLRDRKNNFNQKGQV
jgi:hypothetical protein